jgi:hypothetical protein
MEQEFEREKRGTREREKEKRYLLDVGIITENSRIITEELEWFQRLLDNRVNFLNGTEASLIPFSSLVFPEIKGQDSAYAELVNNYALGPAGRLLLICSLVPHIAPEIFTRRLRNDTKALKIEHPEMGGYFDTTFTNFVPTLQTALYLLAGDDITNTVYYHLALRQSVLVTEQVINFRAVSLTEDDTNERNHTIALAPEFVRYFLSSQKPRPDFGRAFPAVLTSTDLTWAELVLDARTRTQVDEVMNWLAASQRLNNTRKIKRGFPCLFFGSPGTGKTLTAQLIGKTYHKDVFRIDLSMIVSKYVGETEKNLAHLFERAENRDCILFFDEADALFTRRTSVNTANDKWANLEVAYLLQKMEDYPGLTILATNLKDNLDNAMTRRFQAMIHFPRPKKEERVKLWKLALPDGFTYAKNVSFDKLGKYELTGANISNIIKYCCVAAITRSETVITGPDLLKGVLREMAKESRTP